MLGGRQGLPRFQGCQSISQTCRLMRPCMSTFCSFGGLLRGPVQGYFAQMGTNPARNMNDALTTRPRKPVSQACEVVHLHSQAVKHIRRYKSVFKAQHYDERSSWRQVHIKRVTGLPPKKNVTSKSQPLSVPSPPCFLFSFFLYSSEPDFQLNEQLLTLKLPLGK